MNAVGFDPFADRTARLLRNRLAMALVEALAAQSPAIFRRLASQGASELESVHRLYLTDRLRRYERAFSEIEQRRIAQPFEQALVLWNHGLFFEVHAVLETLWRSASGERRLALQAMIRAAGVYIHLEQEGHQAAARRMAEKAVAGLEAYGAALPSFGGCSHLVEALRRLDPDAPPLGPILVNFSTI